MRLYKINDDYVVARDAGHAESIFNRVNMYDYDIEIESMELISTNVLTEDTQ